MRCVSVISLITDKRRDTKRTSILSVNNKQEVRKEGNDQESIHTKHFMSKTPNGTTIETLQAERQKNSFFSKNWPNAYPK